MRSAILLVCCALLSGTVVGAQSLPGATSRRAGPQPPSGSQAQAESPSTAVISGRVTAAETGRPLRGAVVSLNNAGGQPEPRVNRATTTDGDGRYAFTALPPQRYQITASKDGYVTRGRGQISGGTSGPLDLGQGEAADRIDFALPRGGVVTGRITDELGEPLAGLSVQALRAQYVSGGRRQLQPAGGLFSYSTNDLGEFRVWGLAPGSYVVAGSFESGPQMMTVGQQGIVVSVNAQSSGRDADGLGTTYFPGTMNPADAQPVTVDTGQEVSASFALIPVRLARLAGVVRTSQGRPAAGYTIELVSEEGLGPGSFKRAQAGSDGEFALSGIAPGAYVANVRPRMNTSGEGENAAVHLIVTDSDQTNLVITTTSGTPVSGLVQFRGPSPPPTGGIRIFAVSAELSNTPAQAGSSSGVLGPDGRFTVPGATGKVLFRMPLPPPWQLRSVMLNGTEIIDIPTDVDGVKELTGLTLIATDRPARVTGYARNAAGDLVKTYKVALFPVNQPDGAVPQRMMYTTTADQTGRYQFGRLPPGEYVGVATMPFDQWFEWDPEFQAKVKPHARYFKANDGDTVTIDLPYVE